MFSSLLSQANSIIKQAKVSNNTLKKTLIQAQNLMGVAAAQPSPQFNPMLVTAPAASFPKADRFKQKPKDTLGFTDMIGLSESTYSTVESQKGVVFPKQERFKEKKPTVQTLLYPKVDIVKKSTQGVSIVPMPQRQKAKLGKSTYSVSTADGASVASLGPGTYTPNPLSSTKNAPFSKGKRFLQPKPTYTDQLPLYPSTSLTKKRPPTMSTIKPQTTPNPKLLQKLQQQEDRKRLKFLYWQAVPLEFDRLFKSTIGPILKEDYWNVSRMTGMERKCAMQMLIDRMNFLRGGFEYEVKGDLRGEGRCAVVYRKSTPKPFKFPMERSPGPDQYYPKDDLVKPAIVGFKFAKHEDKLVVQDDKRDYDVNYDFFKKVQNTIINPEHQPKRLTQQQLCSLNLGPGFYDALFSQVQRRSDLGIPRFPSLTPNNDRVNNIHQKKQPNDGVYFIKYTALDKNIPGPLYKPQSNVQPEHLPEKQLFPEHWEFYDGDLNKVRAEVAKNVLLAGGMGFEEYRRYAKQVGEFKEFLKRQRKMPEVGEYEVKYQQVDANVMVPDLEKMQERGLIDPIIKQEGEVDGDNLILNPDKPRPKLPNIDFGKMVPRESTQQPSDQPRQGDALILQPRLPEKKLADIKFQKMIGRDDNQPEENQQGNDGERLLLEIKYPDPHIPSVNIEKQAPREEPKDQAELEVPAQGDRLRLEPTYTLVDKKPKGFVDMNRHSEVRLIPILRKLHQQQAQQ